MCGEISKIWGDSQLFRGTTQIWGVLRLWRTWILGLSSSEGARGISRLSGVLLTFGMSPVF